MSYFPVAVKIHSRCSMEMIWLQNHIWAYIEQMPIVGNPQTSHLIKVFAVEIWLRLTFSALLLDCKKLADDREKVKWLKKTSLFLCCGCKWCYWHHILMDSIAMINFFFVFQLSLHACKAIQLFPRYCKESSPKRISDDDLWIKIINGRRTGKLHDGNDFHIT